MRAADLARFINRLRVEKPEGSRETPAEASLVSALMACGALRTEKGGTIAAASNKPVVAAVAGSSNAREVRDALLHEAMHMVFYTDDAFAERCYAFWDENMCDAEREAWVTFLRDLQYNVDDRELVVNELQAYMTTERQLFGGDAGGKGGGKKGGGGGGGGNEALKEVQAKFAAYIAPHLPSPPSIGTNTKVVWL